MSFRKQEKDSFSHRSCSSNTNAYMHMFVYYIFRTESFQDGAHASIRSLIKCCIRIRRDFRAFWLRKNGSFYVRFTQELLNFSWKIASTAVTCITLSCRETDIPSMETPRESLHYLNERCILNIYYKQKRNCPIDAKTFRRTTLNLGKTTEVRENIEFRIKSSLR